MSIARDVIWIRDTPFLMSARLLSYFCGVYTSIRLRNPCHQTSLLTSMAAPAVLSFIPETKGSQCAKCAHEFRLNAPTTQLQSKPEMSLEAPGAEKRIPEVAVPTTPTIAFSTFPPHHFLLTLPFHPSPRPTDRCPVDRDHGLSRTSIHLLPHPIILSLIHISEPTRPY